MEELGVVVQGNGWRVSRSGQGFKVSVVCDDGLTEIATGVEVPDTEERREDAKDRLLSFDPTEQELDRIVAAFASPWVAQ